MVWHVNNFWTCISLVAFALVATPSVQADDATVKSVAESTDTSAVEAGASTDAEASSTSEAQAEPQSEPEPGTLDAIFNQDLPNAIGQSKINFQWRPRYEYADTEVTEPSHAPTMRTVFGLTTADLYSFQGMIEALNVTAIGDSDNYRSGANEGSAGDKTTIADPPTTELNQVWLSYTYANWATSAKGGRQTINLDNQRFVGAVDWRQNPQTYDAVRLENWKLEDATFSYTYIDWVNRVFGNVEGLAAGAQDFKSSSHLIHATYDGSVYANATGYVYLLDLRNDAGAAQSSATYGFSVKGKAPISEEITLNYRGELAWQTDYANSPLSYSAPYLHLTLDTKVKPVTFGVGYELLGSDNNAGFRTPLATLHKFNGWADRFLGTPNTGLQDMYVWGQVKLPGDIPLKVVFHKFDSATGGSSNYGNEFDILLSRKLGKHWSALLKYAYYDGKNGFSVGGGTVGNTDIQRFWAQMELKL